MPQGLQIFNSDSTLALDLTDRVSRKIGEYNNSTAVNGNLSVTITNGCSLWYCINIPDHAYNGAAYPTFTNTSNSISWVYSTGNRVPFTIIYGEY